MSSKDQTRHRAKNAVTFLLWLDYIEKIDALIMEIRHLQVNIIHSLREPALLRPLRFEESYLWGKFVGETETENSEGSGGNGGEAATREISWISLFRNRPGRLWDARRLAALWVIRYPSYDERPGGGGERGPTPGEPAGWHEESAQGSGTPFKDTAYGVRRQIVEDLWNRIESIWLHDLWKQNSKRNYRILCALQILKSNILSDRLELCRWGTGAFRFFDRQPAASVDPFIERQRLGYFLVARSGIAARMQDHVLYFRDLQEQFENSLDVVLEDYPRPLVERRKDQGLYTSFVAERTRALVEEIESLLAAVGRRPAGPNEIGELIPLVLHRWSHDATSQSRQAVDELGDGLDDKMGGRRRVYFINTAYWMPDRPDLQIVIAHEVAHNIVRHRYSGLSETDLSRMDDSFADLFRFLSRAFEVHGVNRRKEEIEARHIPANTLIEISSDLIAASVRGHAYLYPLVLEILGHGLDVLLHTQDGGIDLAMVQYLDGNAGAETDEREWYYRIHIVCAWLEAVCEDRDPLGEQLIEGVRRILEDLHEFLDEVAPRETGEGRWYWSNLKDHLCEIVRTSRAARDVRRWRSRRRKHDPHARQTVYGKSGSPVDDFPYGREFRQLPRDIRETLFGMLLELKFRADRPCGQARFEQHVECRFDWNDPSKCLRIFDGHYFGRDFRRPGPSNRPSMLQDRPIFPAISDIGWQCSMMRAIDFADDAKKGAVEGWFERLNQDAAPGREIFQMALDFFLWYTRPASDRLATAVRVLNDLKQDREKKVPTPFQAKLDAWAEGAAEGAAHFGALVDEIEDLEYRLAHDRMALQAVAKKYSAAALLKIDSGNVTRRRLADASNDDAFRRRLQKVQGHKLKELGQILEDMGEEDSESSYLYKPLKGFLDTRSRPKQNWGLGRLGFGSPTMPNSGFRLLYEAFNSDFEAKPDDVEAGRYGILPSFRIVSRLSFAGPNPVDEPSEPGPSDGELLKDFVGRYAWRDRLPPRERPDAERPGQEHERNTRRLYQVVLGRYDVMMLSHTGPMGRWRLPRWDPGIDEHAANPVERTGQDSGGGDGREEKSANFSDIARERFMPFFERRELAVRMRLKRPENKDPARQHGHLHWPDEGFGKTAKDHNRWLTCHHASNWSTCARTPPPQSLAYVSVVLNQRGSRLDFLIRLLRAIQLADPAEACPDGRHPVLEEIGGIFCLDDYLLLSEGWTDMILVFGAGYKEDKKYKGVDRLAEILKIQKTLYQDFMVSRTEIMLTPYFLSTAAAGGGQDDGNEYQIYAQVRMKADRYLTGLVDKFEDKVIPRLDKEGISLFHTPGRTDFDLVYNKKHDCRYKLLKIADLFGTTPPDKGGDPLEYLDELTTTIRTKTARKGKGAAEPES